MLFNVVYVCASCWHSRVMSSLVPIIPSQTARQFGLLHLLLVAAQTGVDDRPARYPRLKSPHVSPCSEQYPSISQLRRSYESGVLAKPLQSSHGPKACQALDPWWDSPRPWAPWGHWTTKNNRNQQIIPKAPGNPLCQSSLSAEDHVCSSARPSHLLPLTEQSPPYLGPKASVAHQTNHYIYIYTYVHIYIYLHTKTHTDSTHTHTLTCICICIRKWKQIQLGHIRISTCISWCPNTRWCWCTLHDAQNQSTCRSNMQ